MTQRWPPTIAGRVMHQESLKALKTQDLARTDGWAGGQPGLCPFLYPFLLPFLGGWNRQLGKLEHFSSTLFDLSFPIYKMG
jgi:hypothetical protein